MTPEPRPVPSGSALHRRADDALAAIWLGAVTDPAVIRWARGRSVGCEASRRRMIGRHSSGRISFRKCVPIRRSAAQLIYGFRRCVHCWTDCGFSQRSPYSRIWRRLIGLTQTGFASTLERTQRGKAVAATEATGASRSWRAAGVRARDGFPAPRQQKAKTDQSRQAASPGGTFAGCAPAS